MSAEPDHLPKRLWWVLASLTLWTMGAADAVLPALGAAVMIAVGLRRQRSAG